MTFPVNHGQTVNVVAFHATSGEWPDSSKLTAQSTREAALRDFSNFGPEITKLLKLTSPKLDIVSYRLPFLSLSAAQCSKKTTTKKHIH